MLIQKKNNVVFPLLPNKKDKTHIQETFASGQFMRGTDPTKSTWVYPKLKL